VNVQVAMTAYLGAEGRSHSVLGLGGHQRHVGSLADLLQVVHGVSMRPGGADLVTLPVGPDETLECTQFGLFLIQEGLRRSVVLMRGPAEEYGMEGVSLQVLTPDQDAARAFLAEIRRLMVELNVFRGQVVSFGESHMGGWALGRWSSIGAPTSPGTSSSSPVASWK
jgi:hypothetical protein